MNFVYTIILVRADCIQCGHENVFQPEIYDKAQVAPELFSCYRKLLQKNLQYKKPESLIPMIPVSSNAGNGT